ncbi:hypothetical protein ACRZ1S_001588 [Campylobacter jejuni]|nr:hypothetical protein [Campylobacter jejuni]ELK6816349.1 hypothetical protein [Campylobacter jejuni]
MKTTEYNTQQKNNKEYLAEREAVKKNYGKNGKELEKPAINAVFQRLKNK